MAGGLEQTEHPMVGVEMSLTPTSGLFHIAGSENSHCYYQVFETDNTVLQTHAYNGNLATQTMVTCSVLTI